MGWKNFIIDYRRFLRLFFCNRYVYTKPFRFLFCLSFYQSRFWKSIPVSGIVIAAVKLKRLIISSFHTCFFWHKTGKRLRMKYP